MLNKIPIGVFDSGYGGLTVLSELKKVLPEYDFLYLGDNARSPYGNRSFDVVNEFTLEAVRYLFNQGCELVILACNTASAKALRSIQQNELPVLAPNKRVLGVIRPTSEIIGDFSISKHIGILATEGTVKSESYLIEIGKFFPDAFVTQHSCSLWVPLIENNMHATAGGKWFIKEDIKALLSLDPLIDTILLGCTHFPIVSEFIQSIVGDHIRVIPQGAIVAQSLLNYLERHSAISDRCSKNGTTRYLTTENALDFNRKASYFLDLEIESIHISITNHT